MNRRKKFEKAGVLVPMIMLSGILGMGLAGYLRYLSNENRVTLRSHSWANALVLAEAGLEEAMAHINHESTYDNFATNGWSLVQSNYWRTRWIGSDYYRVTISTNMPPVINSIGYARAPLSKNFIQRSVQVGTTNRTPYNKAIISRDKILMGGNGTLIDAFDSSDPLYSTGGQYDPAKRLDTAEVATLSGANDAIDVNQAKIYGSIRMGLSGEAVLGTHGAVGDAAYVNNVLNEGTVQTGHSSKDFTASFPDALVPFSGGAATPTGGLVGGTNYNYVLSSGNYHMLGLTMSSEDKLLVNGDAILHMDGDVNISSKAYIYLAPGATIRMYIDSANAYVAGDGIVNVDGRARDFSIFGTHKLKSLEYAGKAQFSGTVYAPEADFRLGGSSQTVGSFIAKSFDFASTLHYDADLSRNAPGRQFSITSWKED